MSTATVFLATAVNRCLPMLAHAVWFASSTRRFLKFHAHFFLLWHSPSRAMTQHRTFFLGKIIQPLNLHVVFRMRPICLSCCLLSCATHTSNFQTPKALAHVNCCLLAGQDRKSVV